MTSEGAGTDGGGRAALLALLDEERRRFVPPGALLESTPKLTRVSGVGWSAIVYSALGEDEVDAVIDAELRRERDRELEWTVYGHDVPADLRQRLAERGFALGPRESVLMLPLEPLPAWVNAPSEVRVVCARTPADFDTLRGLAERIFEHDAGDTVDELRLALERGSGEHLGYIAFDADGEPVAVGRLLGRAGGALYGLYGGGTLPGHRRQGFYRALVAARARAARALGARYLRVDALPTSERTLLKLGFVPLTDSYPCVLAKSG